MSRRFAAVLTVVSALLFTLGSTAAAEAHALPAAPPSGDDTGIFVVRSGGQSLLDAIAARGAEDPTFRAAAIKAVSKWVTQAKSGKRIALSSPLDDGTADQQLPKMTRLLRNLNAGVSSTASQNTAMTITTLLNPNNFGVRGYAGSPRTYWEQMQLENVGEYCGSSCGITDDLVVKVTVNPGAVTSKITWTASYFPDAGNFGDNHLQIWAVNRGNTVAVENTGEVTAANKTAYQTNNPRLNSSVLTTALALWSDAYPLGHYVHDQAKTNDATCDAISVDNVCRY